jgi:DNA-directed RNA polymerase subunit M/transcription elongation factor TFIIS
MNFKICPKCNHRKLAGPFYQSADYRQDEALVYRCVQCGYMLDEPVANAAKICAGINNERG